MKKKKRVFMTVFCLISMIIVMIVCFHLKNKEHIEYIMTVGKMNVANEEVHMIVDDIKLRNKNNIIGTYKVSNPEFDWNKKYGDKKAYQYLLDNLIDQITKAKIVQQLAIEAQIIDDFDYDIFLQMLDEENEIRREKTLNGEVFYGLEQYNQKQYYQYFNNNLLLQLNTYLIDHQKINVSDNEVEEVYKSNKEYFNYMKFDEVKDKAKNLCYENKIDMYIEDKMKGVKVTYNQEELEKYVMQYLSNEMKEREK